MIKSIKIKNFKGISEELFLNLEGETKRISNYDEMSEQNILYFSSILGKNASGKTSFLDAINIYSTLCVGELYSKWEINTRLKIVRNTSSSHKEYMEKINTIDSIGVDQDVIIKKIMKAYRNHKGEPISFEFTYQYESKELKHIVSLDNEDLAEKILLTENSKTVIEEEFFGKIWDMKLRVLSILDEQSIDLIKTFSLSYRDVIYLESTEGLDMEFDLNDKHEKDLFITWMQIADNKIVGVHLNDEEEIESYIFYDDVRDFEYTMPFQKLSTGTKRWAFLYLHMITALTKQKSFMTIDEVDIALHNSLTQFLIQLFIDKDTNKMGSQLLITTHNPYVIKDSIRKDSINLIVDNRVRNQGRDERLRKDKSFVKNYLSENIGDHPQPDDRISFMECLKGYANDGKEE